jgi:hypothetical protein
LAASAGVLLARFSRPTARVTFSKVAVVAPYNGVPTLSFRLANERRNQILEAQVAVTLVRDERTAEGEWMRRFYDLQLARQRTSPPSARARARARGGSENQRPWPADKVERWSIDRLIPYAKNARTHSDAQIAAIAAGF